MASPTGDPTPSTAPPPVRPGLFAEPRTDLREERRFPPAVVGIAFLVIVVLVAISAMMGRRHGTPAPVKTVQPLASYAPSLALTGVAMSESTSLSGGKSTYLDGKITNQGPATVTGVVVQAVFANDTGMAPAVDTETLNLIRTREPYIDTQPVSAAPLASGAAADFRLIYENLPANWNGQQPELRVIRVDTR